MMLAALVVVGASSAAAGAWWMKARSAAALRDVVDERAHLLALADHWLWRTDADHRLTMWRVPAGEPGGWRDAPASGTPFAALLRPAAAADAVSRQMAAQAAIGGERVVLAWGGVERPWRLRGAPRHDGAGRFLGYLGSARPLAEVEAAGFGRAALARLLPGLHERVRLFQRADDASPWHPVAPHDASSVDEALAGLPAEVARAVADVPADLAADPVREVAGWRVRWTRVPASGDAPAGCLLILGPPAPVAAPSPAAAAPEPATASANDLADQESFIYSVSHDLRAPIRVVEGFARILKEDYGRFLDRIGNDHADRILAAAARMNSMIDALLALSRLQSQPLKRQPVDLSQLARYVLEDLRSNEPGRAAEIHIEPGLVVQGDPTLMRIAVENLVGNAWKYSGQSASTRIELRRETVAGQVAYVVADAGAGFDMRFADRLFGVFQRLHSAKDFQGTGVGLASVRRIIRRHGGEIWAESEVGKGARFYFTLP